jgi:hypothetical protein
MAVTDATVTKEKTPDVVKQTDWHLFFRGSDNIFINDLALRAKRSPTHGAILQSKATYTAGQGFQYLQNDEIIEPDQKLLDYTAEVNSNGDSLHWLFGKVAYDYIYSGNAYIEVVRGKEFTSLFYKDSTKIRVSNDKAYISAFWRDIKNEQTTDKRKPIESVDLWDGNVETKQKRFIIHIKNHVPEYDFYGLPEHLPVLKWADIEYKMVQFNLDMLKNGFFPSVAIDIVGTPPEGMTGQQYVEEIRDKLTDEGNNHKMFIQLVDDVAQATNITEFSSVKDGQMMELSGLAVDNIIAGHRWFPSLAGLAISGSLGSNQQIRNEYNIALKGVIIPQFQKPLERVFNNILKMVGFDVKVEVINVAPVGIEDRIEPKEVMTVNEQRELLGIETLEGQDVIKETQKGGMNGTNN